MGITIKNATSFIFDGISCKRFGAIICSFDNSNGINEITPSADINIETETTNDGYMTYGLSSSYADSNKIEFDIAKTNGHPFSTLEIRKIMRWIQQMKSGFKELQFNSYSARDLIFYAKCVSATELTIAGETCGFRLSFIKNQPYAVTKPATTVIDMESSTYSLDYFDLNDEVKDTIISMKITIKENCNFSIYNSLNDRKFQISNCVAGEIISVNGDTLYMTSNVRGTNVISSFNGVWMMITNTLDETTNPLTFFGKAKVELTTSYSRKVGV